MITSFLMSQERAAKLSYFFCLQKGKTDESMSSADDSIDDEEEEVKIYLSYQGVCICHIKV